MCLIIADSHGNVPDDYTLRYSYNVNPDGWGVMYLNNGSIQVDKGMHAESLVKAMKRIAGKPYVIHLRYATHGAVNRDNTHPFRIQPGLWMAHNGIINIPITDKRYSDTWHFAKELTELISEQPNWFGTNRFHEDAEDLIGRGNKLAFLDNNGKITIVNENAGLWIGTTWFSNEYSLPWHVEKKSPRHTHFDSKFSTNYETYDPRYSRQSALFRCDICYTRLDETNTWDELCFDCAIEEAENNNDFTRAEGLRELQEMGESEGFRGPFQRAMDKDDDDSDGGDTLTKVFEDVPFDEEDEDGLLACNTAEFASALVPLTSNSYPD